MRCMDMLPLLAYRSPAMHHRDNSSAPSQQHNGIRNQRITPQVAEPKQDNSGIPQGIFVRRHQVPKGDGRAGIISPADLAVGDTVTLYGRTFFLVSPDVGRCGGSTGAVPIKVLFVVLQELGMHPLRCAGQELV